MLTFNLLLTSFYFSLFVPQRETPLSCERGAGGIEAFFTLDIASISLE